MGGGLPNANGHLPPRRGSARGPAAARWTYAPRASGPGSPRACSACRACTCGAESSSLAPKPPRLRQRQMSASIACGGVIGWCCLAGWRARLCAYGWRPADDEGSARTGEPRACKVQRSSVRLTTGPRRAPPGRNSHVQDDQRLRVLGALAAAAAVAGRRQYRVERRRRALHVEARVLGRSLDGQRHVPPHVRARKVQACGAGGRGGPPPGRCAVSARSRPRLATGWLGPKCAALRAAPWRGAARRGAAGASLPASPAISASIVWHPLASSARRARSSGAACWIGIRRRRRRWRRRRRSVPGTRLRVRHFLHCQKPRAAAERAVETCNPRPLIPRPNAPARRCWPGRRP
jgi:hypothetical protein